MNEIVKGEIKDPREYYPHISDWLVEVLFASVHKDRTKRIQSSDEFTKRLLSKEGRAAVMGTTDKTIIEEPKSAIKEPQKTVTPPPPVQTKPKPVKTIKPVKPKSSNKKIFLFGGIGLIAAVIIYFAVTSNSEPYPYGPLIGEDSILIIDEPYINKNYNMESVLSAATPQPEGRTKRRNGLGIPGQAQLTYPAY